MSKNSFSSCIRIPLKEQFHQEDTFFRISVFLESFLPSIFLAPMQDNLKTESTSLRFSLSPYGVGRSMVQSLETDSGQLLESKLLHSGQVLDSKLLHSGQVSEPKLLHVGGDLRKRKSIVNRNS